MAPNLLFGELNVMESIMKCVYKLTVILCLISSSLIYANVSVTSYNMGQLNRKGIDFVACTKSRVAPQVEAIFYNKDSPLLKEKHFVLFIQEAWTSRVFKALLAEATKHNYYMYPQNYQDLKSNGQITITNLKPLETVFVPYTIDSHARKGMLYTRLDLGDGKTLGTMNVHTAYSDLHRFSKTHEIHFREIADFITNNKQKSDYFVIGGDFNAGPDMGYKSQKYDSAKIVWEDGFMPAIHDNDLKLISDQGYETWDASQNTLVSKPTFTIRMMNFVTRRFKTSWNQTDSTLDHILVSKDIEVLEHRVVFEKPVPLRCLRRQDKDGNVPLSDHFGVNAILEI